MTPRHDLDAAIDLVAKQMTSIADDERFADRIVASLPQRSLSIGWVARLAMGALATLAIIVVLRSFYGSPTTVLRTENTVPVASLPIVEPSMNDPRTSVEPALIARRTIVERPLNDRRTESDHEFSLPALDAVVPLEDEALTLAPLEIADLPLTSDFPH